MVAYQGRGRQMSVSSRTVRALLHRETLSQKEKKKKVTVSQEVRIMTSLLHRQSRTLIKKKKKKKFTGCSHGRVYLWPPKAGLRASRRNFAEPT